MSFACLQQKGAQVSYHDPYIPRIKHDDWTIDSITDLDNAVRKADCVVIVTNHSAYDYNSLLKNAQLDRGHAQRARCSWQEQSKGGEVVMAKYLVTGAAGFIARRLIEELTSRGDQVVGVDNLNDAYDVRIKHWRLNQLKQLERFTFIKDDICRQEMFADLQREHPHFDAVIHLAARAGVRQAVEIPRVFLETNANGTLNVLEWCRNIGSQKNCDGLHLLYIRR